MIGMIDMERTRKLALDPAAIASAVREACVLEVRAFKPGNVSIASAGHGMNAPDFVASADAMAGVIAEPAMGVGERILRAVESTRVAVAFNTNLGIVLLCAPLVEAAIHRSAEQSLRLRLDRVLAALDVIDAELAYRAIRLAQPGGLGTADRHDVAEIPRVTLLEAMREARQRDRIAAQYVTRYHDVLKIGVPIARQATQRWGSREWAAVAVYLAFLSRFGDSHIARKHGNETAFAVSREAEELEKILAAARDPAGAMEKLEAFDRRLKARSINPGTSADLTVATMLAMTLDDLLDAAFRAPARNAFAGEPAGR
jgi:triphosphoribosyl-dephospho-CoA synthase